MQITAKDLGEAVDLYRDDLPSPQLFPAEFRRWKAWAEASKQDVANSCASLQLCQWQRANVSVHLRCTMGETRPFSLALMHVSNDIPTDLDEVVFLFARLHPRLMELSNLILQWLPVKCRQATKWACLPVASNWWNFEWFTAHDYAFTLVGVCSVVIASQRVPLVPRRSLIGFKFTESQKLV